MQKCIKFYKNNVGVLSEYHRWRSVIEQDGNFSKKTIPFMPNRMTIALNSLLSTNGEFQRENPYRTSRDIRPYNGSRW